MSKKHYESIARVLAAFASFESNAPIGRTTAEIARTLASEFARDNPRFDTARFLKAAGVSLAVVEEVSA